MDYASTIVTAPTVEPVTIAEAKGHLRVDVTDEDTYISGILIPAAREYCEKATRRALCTQTWDIAYPRFPNGSTMRRIVYGVAWDERRIPNSTRLEIPLPPLQSVTHIKYYDTAGVQQTWAAASYVVHIEGGHGFVELATGYDWPQTQSDRSNPVTVRIVCGYGAAAAVPNRIKQACLLLVGDGYAFRETTITGTISSSIDAVSIANLLSPYVVREF